MQRRVNSWLNALVVLGLLGVGIFIFLLSLYSASLAGLRKQLGLVGGDLSKSIDLGVFYRGLVEYGSLPSCNYYRAVAGIPVYLITKGEKKIEIGDALATQRMECGARYVLDGNTERGVYTFVKAIRYSQTGLNLIKLEIERDKNKCMLYRSDVSYGIIETYLEAAEGNARGIIEREYQELQRLKQSIEEVCGL